MTADPAVATATTTGTAAWLHGVVPAATVATLAPTAGLGDLPVRVVRASGLAAVVSAVPLPEYGEQSLRRNLEDLTWLEHVARVHHRVVDTLARGGPVVPARLATVHTDERRLAALLDERRADLTATLDRLAGHQEWGVKGYLVPGGPTGFVPEAAERGRGGPRADESGGGGSGESGGRGAGSGESGGGGAGAAYLRRRRAQLLARESGQQLAARSAAAVHQDLTGYATETRLHQPQDRRLTGAAGPMLLNGAYLVPVERVATFKAAVAEFTRSGPTLRLELTGPWPPYSFVAGHLGT